MPNPTVSVIVITYNRAHKILNILKALEKQTFKDFELVIIIDGSHDNTREVIEQSKLDFKSMRVIWQENGGRSIARNNGAKEAKGELLVFFDDDMRPFPDCVAVHVQHHQKFPGSICIGTQEEDPQLATKDYQQYRLHLTQKWTSVFPPYGQPMPKRQTYFTTGNCSIARADFMAIGGFDPRVIDIEDFEMGARAVEKGYQIYYQGQARAYHDDLDIFSKFVKRQRDYARAYQKLPELLPHMRNQFIATEEYKPSPLKKMAFTFFAQPALVRSIDKFDWLKFILPRQTRFSVYSYITTAFARIYPEKNIT